MYKRSVTVCMCWHGNGVVGPYYFNIATVQGVDHFITLDTYILSEAQQFPQNALFQQDGSPFYITRAFCSRLDEKSPSLWIGRYSPTGWTARLPDLAVLDFLLWGLVKNQEYRISVPMLTELKQVIKRDNRTLSYEVLNNVWKNSENLLHTFNRKSSDHKEHKWYSSRSASVQR